MLELANFGCCFRKFRAFAIVLYVWVPSTYSIRLFDQRIQVFSQRISYRIFVLVAPRFIGARIIATISVLLYFKL